VPYKVISSDKSITNVYTVTVTVSPLPVVVGLARWFDASTIAGKVDGEPVTTWADLSGNGANATVPSGNTNPTYIANAGTASRLPALHFSPGSGAPNSGALGFTRDSSIGTVFSVFKGNSFLLTDANNYDFHRPTDNNPASPIWDSGNASANIRNGATYVNGALVNGTTYAMPTDLNNGFNLVEVLTVGPVQADSFNKDRPYHSGDQYQAEVIIYDQVLTEDERVAVEHYLMTKWLGVYYSLAVTMDSPFNNQGYPSGSSVTATATVHVGTSPYTVTFYKKVGAGGFVQEGSPVTAAGPTFTKALGSLASSTYQIYATVTDSAAATAASKTNTFVVQPPVTTTTTLGTSVSPSTYGQSVTLTATVSPTPSGGTVQFYDNAVALGSPVAVNISGQAQVSTSLLAAGNHPITASYSGFSFYAASTAAALAQTVNRAVLTVTADNKIRAPGIANPAFTYKITGYQNGQDATSAGITGAPVLGTVANAASPVGTYPITNVVGTLTAANYSFTAVPGTLIVMVGAVPVVDGLACWYDASVSVTNDAGGGVKAWGDLSGNGHLATQASGWATNVPNEINSRAVVQIRGSGTWLNCAGKMFTKEQYVVVRSPNDTWNGSGSFLARASADFLTVRASSYNLANGTTGFWQDHFPTAVSKNGTALPAVGPCSTGGNPPHFCLDPITDYMIVKITVDATASAANLAQYPFYQIGRNETLGSCDMDIAEIIGYEKALSSEDEFAVTSFLGAKYGIAVSAYRWKGPNNGNWSAAGNWNSLVPGAGNVAVFSDSASAGGTVKLDTDVTIAGLTFNNKVANQTIAPAAAETLTLDSGTTVASSIVIEGGSPSITAAINAPQNLKVSGPASATLNLYGAITTGMSDGWDEELIKGPNVVLNGTASWTSTGARYMTIGSPTGATLTINDNATIDWSLSWDMFIAWNTGDIGKVVQNGGTVRTPAVSTAWFNNNGPGVQLGGASDPVTAEYDLNGGTLITPNVYNVNGLPLTPPTGSAVFRFNGGVLQGTQNDNLSDPDVVREGSTNLMGNLTHAYVGNGGAKIDTAGFTCGFGQALEHDPIASATDGGLTKLGTGTLTLYKNSTYTGSTKVMDGVLSCATATSLAATPLEIAATAVVDLQYSGTRTIPSLKLGGVVKAPGVYGAGTAPTYFTGTGTVTVTPPTPELPLSGFTLNPPTFANIPTVAGSTYWLTCKDSLAAAGWTRLVSKPGTGGNMTLADPTPANLLPANRFYRLEVTTP
jgi:autotransporter-associated beta strand protein